MKHLTDPNAVSLETPEASRRRVLQMLGAAGLGVLQRGAEQVRQIADPGVLELVDAEDVLAAVDQQATSIYAGWLITGERPGFSSRSGVWGTTRVLRPVQEGGIGAFELAARYDRYDFLDVARGGEGTAWTLGVNWYLNNWSRLMLNYVHWKTDNKVGNAQGPDSGNTVGVRAQVSF